MFRVGPTELMLLGVSALVVVGLVVLAVGALVYLINKKPPNEP